MKKDIKGGIKLIQLSIYVRAGAILIFVFDLANHLTIAVGTQGKITYQISAFYVYPPPIAGPLKFRPRSTGGRNFEVGILASNKNSIIQIDPWEHENGIRI